MVGVEFSYIDRHGRYVLDRHGRDVLDCHGRDVLDFCNLSGCEQLVRCLTNISGNKLDLVMTDAPEIVDMLLVLHLTLLITTLSVVCFWLGNQYLSTMSEVLSF